MARLAVIFICCTILLNGACGCCSCCSMNAGYPGVYDDYSVTDGYYPGEYGYDAGGAAGCGCDGGGIGANHGAAMDYSYAQSRPVAAPRYQSVAGSPPQYAAAGMPRPIPQTQRAAYQTRGNPYAGQIQQTSLSTWDGSTVNSGALPPQMRQQAAPCNCGKH